MEEAPDNLSMGSTKHKWERPTLASLEVGLYRRLVDTAVKHSNRGGNTLRGAIVDPRKNASASFRTSSFGFARLAIDRFPSPGRS